MGYMRDSTGRRVDSFEIADAKRVREVSLQPVCSRTMVIGGTLSSSFVGPGKSNGTDTRGMYRTRHTTLAPFHHPRLVYSNIINNNGTEVAGDNAITISASIELPSSGGFIRATFNGQTSVTIQPGATVMSDPIGFAATPADILLWYSRTYVSVASAGMTWPLSLIAGTGDAAERGTANNDKTMTGTIAGAYERTFGPAAIVGALESRVPSVAIVGDSIAQGYSETYFNSFLAQALTNLSIPFINFAAGSEQTSKWGGNIGRALRSPLLQHCTHVIFENGFNSLSTSWANVQTFQLQAWDYFDRLGMPVFQTTITPGTTSTDLWATAGNQTVLANEANRVLINDWIRGVPEPLSGYIEAADAAMTARNSGIWKTDGTAQKWTSDGAHPSPFGHAELATAVQPQIAALLAA